MALLAVDSKRAGVRPKGSFADRLKTLRDRAIDMMREEDVPSEVKETVLEDREQVVGLQLVMDEIARGIQLFRRLGKIWNDTCSSRDVISALRVSEPHQASLSSTRHCSESYDRTNAVLNAIHTSNTVTIQGLNLRSLSAP